MNFIEADIYKSETIKLVNLLKEIRIEDIQQEIVEGLLADKKWISSKFFYNEKGSQLFEKITHLDEYYPTRTEISILKDTAPELLDGNPCEIIELGSGDCKKASLIVEAIPDYLRSQCTYKPIDVSLSAIMESAKGLSEKFPTLNILGYGADFTKQFNQIPRSIPALICFLGSTIGNFDPQISLELLKTIRENMIAGDRFLLGVDLIKSKDVLHAAYNDSEGVTAAFNKNILSAINSYIQSDFDETNFGHHAFLNEEESRIEMHLIANIDVKINSPFFIQPLKIPKGESIHTENSYKFSIENIKKMADKSELKIKNIHIDENDWFALVEFQK